MKRLTLNSSAPIDVVAIEMRARAMRAEAIRTWTLALRHWVGTKTRALTPVARPQVARG